MIEDLNSLGHNERDLEISEIVNDLYYNYGSIRNTKSIMPFPDASGCVIGQAVVMLSTELPMVGVIKDRLGNDVTVESGGRTYNGNELYMTALH